MEIEIKALGGYEEVGRNMTALRIDDEVIILDMGLHVDRIVSYGERDALQKLPLEKLYEIEALPDDRLIENWRDKVKGIFISHGHLDHVAGAPFLASKYKAPIYATPFTIEVLKFLAKDNGVTLPNPLKAVPPNSRVRVSDKIEVEFVYVTHSIPHSTIIVVHTPEGAIVYACDYKWDNHPLIGQTSNVKRLKEIAREEDILALIVESTRVDEESKTPSEIIARYMLEDVLKSLEDTKAIIVTTFSSHIARLKSIFELAWEIDRIPVFLGRSLAKYIGVAEKLGFINFTEETDVLGNPKDIAQKLKEVQLQKDKYLLVVTGHQGEPGSVLDRMSREQLPWKWDKEDVVIFSSFVIPYPTNIANRQIIEQRLKHKGVHIIKDVHVSGHARKEDHRRLLRILKPKLIIPMHGEMHKRAAYVELAIEEGYEFGKDVVLLQNGQSIKI